MRSFINTLANMDGTLSSENSCFKVNVSEIASGEPYVFGLKHLKELMQHAVNLVQDLLDQDLGANSSSDWEKYLAAEWEIYIGNSPIWHENPRCPVASKLDSSYLDHLSTASGKGYVPRYGFTEYCNMPGQFTFFVARSLPSESVTLCNTGVIGTTYDRDEPLDESI